MAESGRSLLIGQAKKQKQKNDDSEKCVRQQMSRSEQIAFWRWTNKASEQIESKEENLNLWMCSGLMPQPIDRLCSHYIESKQSVKEERRGVGSPERCLLTLLNAAGSMLRSPIPSLCGPLAGWILSRLRLSVDLPEGLDNETVILKLGHSAAKAILFYFQLIFSCFWLMCSQHILKL